MKTHTGGVCGVWVILQHSGKAKIRHLTHQVAVDQDVTGSQVSVDVSQIGQVGHTSRDATQQPNQLDNSKLAIMSLQDVRKRKGRGRKYQEGGGKERQY